jgi:hypothetical protein
VTSVSPVVSRSTDTPLPMWNVEALTDSRTDSSDTSLPKGLLDGSSHCLLAVTELVTMGRQVAWFTVCEVKTIAMHAAKSTRHPSQSMSADAVRTFPWRVDPRLDKLQEIHSSWSSVGKAIGKNDIGLRHPSQNDHAFVPPAPAGDDRTAAHLT